MAANLLNFDILSGVLQIVIGIVVVSCGGLRVTIIMSCTVFLIAINLIWIGFSEIYDNEQTYNYSVFDAFDKTMYFIEGSLSESVYYLCLISAGVDICKTYMLQENKRIYALLLCFIGGIKLGL